MGLALTSHLAPAYPVLGAVLPVFAFLDSQHLGAFLGGDGVGWLRGNALGNACFGGLKEKRGGRE